MVNNTIISQHTGPLPEGDNRAIGGGPLYSKAAVLGLLASEEPKFVAWTKKCIQDMQKWGLGAQDLVDIVRLAFTSGRFTGSEWCKQNPTGPWAACDAYSAVRDDWIHAMHKEMSVEYYVKFSIGKTGTILLVASFHPSEYRS